MSEIKREAGNPFAEISESFLPKGRVFVEAPEGMSVEKADKIYDKIMEGALAANEAEKPQEMKLEDVFQEIYDRDEDEFSFEGFKLESERLDKIYRYFEPAVWEKLDVYDKQSVLREFGLALAEVLGLKYPPRMTYFSGAANNCGAYDYRNNDIKVNNCLINDVKGIVNTVAHESFHAYQHQRARMPETRKDVLYAINFNNYISPGHDVNGNCVNFHAYESQLVEAEARGYAKQFSERIGA